MKPPGKGSSTWGLFVYSCLSACPQTDHFTKSGERKKLTIKWGKKNQSYDEIMEVRLRLFAVWDTLSKYVVVGSPLVPRGDHATCITWCFSWEELPSGRASHQWPVRVTGWLTWSRYLITSLPAVSKDEIPLCVTQSRAAPLQKMLSSWSSYNCLTGNCKLTLRNYFS